MLPINSYVLFAANVDDFRNLAKKFIPGDLAEKLTDLVSQNGGKSVKDRVTTNEDISNSKTVRERTAATIYGDIASRDVNVYQTKGDQHNRPNEGPNPKSQVKFEYDETQYSKLDKTPHGERFDGRPPIQVHVEFEDEQLTARPKIKPTVNNFQRDRIPNANMKKRQAEDISEKKRPIYNQQEKQQDDYLDDKVYKKSNFESRFEDAEQKNTYVNKMHAYQNGNMPKVFTKFPHDSRYESEEFVTEGKKPKNEWTTVKVKQQPRFDYDYDFTTTQLVTLKEKRYRTVRSRISKTNSQHLSAMKFKETFSRAVTPKEPLFVKPEMKRVVKQRQRILPPTPERDYDMRQKKLPPMRNVELGIRPNSQGRANEMRIHNAREIKVRTPQKQKAVEDDGRYVKTHPSNPTNNDYNLPYERPHPAIPTKNYYDRYERPRPSKPTQNDYDLPYDKPYQSKPTKNDYDLPYEKPYPSKPIKNNYKAPYENPYASKPTKNDYDLDYEKSNPSKPTNHDYDLYYEKPNPSKPTSNNNKIFPTKQTKPVKDDDYFDDDKFKPTVKIQRMPGPNIQQKPAQQGDIFTSFENPSVLSNNDKKNIDNLPPKRPVANEKKPVANEQDQDMYEEVVYEPVKARTENLNFDVDYDNNTGRIPTTRHIMKGTGIPTRQTYRMSSPDYYKRLPRIVEKYDFSEPIPEADRVREVPNDKLVLEQGRVNKKVKQQKQDIFKTEHEERPEYEPIKGHNDNNDNNDQQGPIMEEFSLVR